jgi:hypothetical protein
MLLLVACSSPRSESAPAGGAGDSPVSSATNAASADSARAPIPRSACRETGAGGGVPATNEALGMPPGADGIRGLITQLVAPWGQVEGFRILVEQDSTRSAGTPKASVFVPATTRVMQRVGHQASPGLLRLCQEVSVWFDGPVAESFPVQARAGGIVIERSLELTTER